MPRTRFTLRSALIVLLVTAAASYTMSQRLRFLRMVNVLVANGGNVWFDWQSPQLDNRGYVIVKQNGRMTNRNLNSRGWTPVMPVTAPDGTTRTVTVYMKPYLAVTATKQPSVVDFIIQWTGHAKSRISTVEIPISNFTEETIGVLQSLAGLRNIVASQPKTQCDPHARLAELKLRIPHVNIQPKHSNFNTWVPLSTQALE